MSALRIYKDFDGTFRIEGYPELPFSSEEDAESAAELCLYYYVDRHSREMQQDQRYRRAEQRVKA